MAAEFPLHALPPNLQQFVEASASAMGAPPDYVALSTLVAVGVSIGTARTIVLKVGWEERPNLYAALVGDPGSLKSPSLGAALHPVRMHDQMYTDGRSWTSDATVEGLGGLLAENPGGLVLCRDELSGWIRSMNMYKGGKGADREFFLSTWTSEPITIDRKSCPPIKIPAPFLSIIGGLTPDNLSTLVEVGGKNDGFLERILYTWPSPQPHRWSEAEVPKEVTEAYYDLIRQLYTLSDTPTMARLQFTPEAKTRWQTWHDDMCQKGEDALLSPFLRGTYTKFLRYGARLALIHALATNPRATAVDLSSVEASIALIDYFENQASKVDRALTHSPNTPLERMKAAILRRLSVCRYPMKQRDLQRGMNGDAQTFHQALKELSQPIIHINTYNKTIEIYRTNAQPPPGP